MLRLIQEQIEGDRLDDRIRALSTPRFLQQTLRFLLNLLENVYNLWYTDSYSQKHFSSLLGLRS